ncbi:uncharacterized protein [Drosophila bipectinata]|uniref:uncharacterized protein n=1 Tax=Drosophila bipectinata TaxID=42026 RepID=UPI001C8AAA1D|nr:uncharacterized protein LOC108130378 [Drosophila bipectinata]
MSVSKNIQSSDYNDDELVPPEWLDVWFIAKALRDHHADPDLKVLEVIFSPATAKGDHYASIMFRAKVRYATPRGGELTTSLIIKTMPVAEGHKKDMIAGSPIFITEVGMYTKVLPELERILLQAGDHTKLFVECIYHSMEPHQVLIFKDLVDMGYFVPRDRGITEAEIRLAYFKLAKLHAASLKVQNESPQLIKGFTHGLFEMPHVLQEPFLKTGMVFFIELLDREPELNKYKPYFESIGTDFLERLIEEWKQFRNNPPADPFTTLCHGDFHLRNMMFKYEMESFEDVMLLDFQISNVYPLTIDLVYSIYMLMEPEFRWNHWEDLINYYYSVFKETLGKICYKGEMPTLAGLWQRMHQHKYYEFFLLSTFVPFMWALKDNSEDFGDILQNEDKRRLCSFSKGYINDVKIILARMDKLGYFEKT